MVAGSRLPSEFLSLRFRALCSYFAMHTMGTSFVGKVRDVRQIAEAQIGEGVADMVDFKAQVSGHEATEKASRIQVWQHLSDFQLANSFERNRPVLILPGSGWSGQHEPEFESARCGKSRHAERGASNVHSAGWSRSLTRIFTRCN